MKLIEVTKNGQQILSGLSIGDHGINNPVEIKFVIDESDYQKMEYATSYYKWDIYDAIDMFFKHAEDIVGEMEYKTQTGEYSDEEDLNSKL